MSTFDYFEIKVVINLASGSLSLIVRVIVLLFVCFDKLAAKVRYGGGLGPVYWRRIIIQGYQYLKGIRRVF